MFKLQNLVHGMTFGYPGNQWRRHTMYIRNILRERNGRVTIIGGDPIGMSWCPDTPRFSQ